MNPDYLTLVYFQSRLLCLELRTFFLKPKTKRGKILLLVELIDLYSEMHLMNQNLVRTFPMFEEWQAVQLIPFVLAKTE